MGTLMTMSKKELRDYQPGFRGAKSQECKKIITNEDVPVNFEFFIQIDKNNSICDFQPRQINGVDLFSMYHGRPAAYRFELINSMNLANQGV
jgi:hypothetical protein